MIRHGMQARQCCHVPAQLRTLGLVKRRGRQRTDRLAVLTGERDLTALQMIVETLRLALQALLQAAAAWTRDRMSPTWEDVCGARCNRANLMQAERQGLPETVGPDGEWLLERLRPAPAPRSASGGRSTCR